MSEQLAEVLQFPAAALEDRARVVIEPGPTSDYAAPEAQFVSAAEVSRRFGVSRRWVYDHAEELGALYLGTGRRPRVRFDPDEVAERLGGHSQETMSRRREERPAPARGGDLNSTRFRRRAELRSLTETKNGRGGALTPPDPAPSVRRNEEARPRRASALPAPALPPERRRQRMANAKRPQGLVVETDLKKGRSFALRFRAYGERRYLTLGFDSEGWTPERAQEELDNILADVRRGIWIPPTKRKRADREEQGGGSAPEEPALFGPFATELIAARRGQVAEKTTGFEEWGLAHLLPYFADWSLLEIDIPAVDAYRLAKVRESEARTRAIERRKPQRTASGQVMKPLAPTSINKTIDCLQFILGAALEQKLVIENAAMGRKRRMKVPPRRPVHLDTAGQIEALLETAARLDREPQMHGSEREPIIATLIFAGPRAHELCNLLWRDVDLANGRILIGRSKSQAGLREISILPVLHDYLAAHKAASYRGRPEDLVFSNVSGGALNKDSLRKGVLIAAFERTDSLLEARAQVPLPVGLTAHKLRHTFASVLIACGEDPNSVMSQLGHSDPKFTLRVYSHLMAREPAERSRLKALVRGERVVAREAPLPVQLESTDYELPIMRALVDRGGAGPCREVIAAVGEAMADQHSGFDNQRLPSGGPRWESQVRKARSSLVKRGWVISDSPRGVWEVPKIGRAKVRRDERRSEGDRLPAQPVSERGPGVLA